MGGISRRYSKRESTSYIKLCRKIGLEANYYITEAHRFQGTNKVVATYKLEQ